MKSFKLSVVAAFCLAMAWPLLTHAAGDDILDQIPFDATKVLFVHGMADTGHSVHNYLVQVGLHVPENFVDLFLTNMGLNSAVRESGSMAIVAVNMPVVKDGPKQASKPYVLLLPANNPKAMLANLHPIAIQQGIYLVTLPNQTESAYVAIAGEYVAVSQDRAVLECFMAHKETLAQLPAKMRTVFDNNDAVLYVNISALSDKLSTRVDQISTALKTLNKMAVAGNMTKEQQALLTDKLQLLGDGLKQYIHDTQITMFTVRMNDQGVRLGVSSFFKADSVLAKAAAAQKALPPVTFDLLPQGDYLAAGSGAWDGATAGDLLDAVFNKLIGDPNLESLVPQLQRMADLDKQIMTLALHARIMIFAPTQNDFKKINGFMVIDSNDPEKLQSVLIEAARQPVIQSCPGLTTTITVEKNAEVIKGVPLTKITIKMTPQPESPDHPLNAKRKQQIAALLYAQGKKGFAFFTGVTHKKLVVLLGNDLKITEPGIIALQTPGTAGLSKQLVESTPGEPPVLPGATSVLYLPVERWMNLAQAAATTLPATATAPASTPAAQPIHNVFLPIIISKAFSDDAMRVQWVIPQALLVDLTRPMINGTKP